MACFREVCLGAVSSSSYSQSCSQSLQRDVQNASWGIARLPTQLTDSSRKVNWKNPRRHTLSISRQRKNVVEASYAGQEDLLGTEERPNYYGDTLLAKLATTLINIKPVWGVMKVLARQHVMNGAMKRGVMWREQAEQLQQVQELFAEKESIEDKSIVYPDYYIQAFHAYNDGNLCWQAAYEVESATQWMVCNTFRNLNGPEECAAALRTPWIERINDHHSRFSGGLPVRDVLDVGCSAGASTFCLADAFPQASVTGLDLSPYFLALASYREKQNQREGNLKRKPVLWLHAKGEETNLPSASFDVVSIAFVVHECPTSAIEDLIQEARRLLRTGGTLVITDSSPRAKIFQTRPLAVSVFYKATEPWTDEYFHTDMEALMQQRGFSNVLAVMTDPRHHTVTGTAA